MGWRVEGEGSKGRGHVHLWLIHIALWQNPKQYWKTVILQLKINFINMQSSGVFLACSYLINQEQAERIKPSERYLKKKNSILFPSCSSVILSVELSAQAS